jgi:hypothetical protein
LVTLLLLALNIGLLFPMSLIIMPATMAILVWPFAQLQLHRHRAILAGLLAALIGYLHLGIGSMTLVGFILLAIARPDCRRPAVIAIVAALIVFSPWLSHLWQHRAFLHSGTSRLPIFMPVATAIGGVAGVWIAIRKREPAGLAVVAMALAAGVFLVTLPERFWTTSGFLWALLGGYGWDRWSGRSWRWGAVALALSAATVTPFLRPATLRFAIPVPFQSAPLILGTPLSTVVCWRFVPEADAGAARIPEDLQNLARWLNDHAGPDEILMTEDRLLGSALFVLTGRPTTSGLWSEVMTDSLRLRTQSYQREARGILILNRNAMPTEQPSNGLVPVTEFGRYIVLRRT